MDRAPLVALPSRPSSVRNKSGRRETQDECAASAGSRPSTPGGTSPGSAGAGGGRRPPTSESSTETGRQPGRIASDETATDPSASGKTWSGSSLQDGKADAADGAGWREATAPQAAVETAADATFGNSPAPPSRESEALPAQSAPPTPPSPPGDAGSGAAILAAPPPPHVGPGAVAWAAPAPPTVAAAPLLDSLSASELELACVDLRQSADLIARLCAAGFGDTPLRDVAAAARGALATVVAASARSAPPPSSAESGGVGDVEVSSDDRGDEPLAPAGTAEPPTEAAEPSAEAAEPPAEAAEPPAEATEPPTEDAEPPARTNTGEEATGAGAGEDATSSPPPSASDGDVDLASTPSPTSSGPTSPASRSSASPSSPFSGSSDTPLSPARDVGLGSLSSELSLAGGLAGQEGGSGEEGALPALTVPGTPGRDAPSPPTPRGEPPSPPASRLAARSPASEGGEAAEPPSPSPTPTPPEPGARPTPGIALRSPALPREASDASTQHPQGSISSSPRPTASVSPSAWPAASASPSPWPAASASPSPWPAASTSPAPEGVFGGGDLPSALPGALGGTLPDTPSPPARCAPLPGGGGASGPSTPLPRPLALLCAAADARPPPPPSLTLRAFSHATSGLDATALGDFLHNLTQLADDASAEDELTIRPSLSFAPSNLALVVGAAPLSRQSSLAPGGPHAGGHHGSHHGADSPTRAHHHGPAGLGVGTAHGRGGLNPSAPGAAPGSSTPGSARHTRHGPVRHRRASSDSLAEAAALLQQELETGRGSGRGVARADWAPAWGGGERAGSGLAIRSPLGLAGDLRAGSPRAARAERGLHSPQGYADPGIAGKGPSHSPPPPHRHHHRGGGGRRRATASPYIGAPGRDPKDPGPASPGAGLPGPAYAGSSGSLGFGLPASLLATLASRDARGSDPPPSSRGGLMRAISAPERTLRGSAAVGGPAGPGRAGLQCGPILSPGAHGAASRFATEARDASDGK